MDSDPPIPPTPDRTGDGGAIHLAAVTTGYRKGKPVLRDVSFGVEPGEVAAIVGPNGSGKTTLFRLLMGFLRPWEGVATVGGMAPAMYRRQVGLAFLPDSIAAPPGWSGLALLRQGVARVGSAGPGREAELHRAVERTGLSSEALSGSMEHLSKGMARRVVAATVLSGAPSPVLLDEPLTGLDAPSRVRLRQDILRCAEGGATVVMASHDLDEVQRIATRVVLLREGVVEEVLEGRRQVTQAALERMVLGEGDHSGPPDLEEAP